MNIIEKLLRRFDTESPAYQDKMRINSVEEQTFPEHPRYLTYSETESLMKTLKWIVEENPHPENVRTQIKAEYNNIMKAWNHKYEPK